MTNRNGESQRVAVIGGGISGLSAAHRLVELRPELEVRLFEAAPRLGGVLQTVRDGEFLMERSADNFITSVPAALDLCRRVGLAGEMLGTKPVGRRALVVHRGRVVPIPEGFLLLAPSKLWPLVTTPLLSPLGKLRLLAEPLVKKRSPPGDESLGSFVRRRLGREAFDQIVQPLVGGIYTADPEQLSVAATMPQFLEMEQQYGSLIRGALQRNKQPPGAASNSASREPAGEGSGARYSLFTTPREGISQMLEAIARRLPSGCCQQNTRIDAVHREAGGGWQLSVSAAGTSSRERFDAVIVACPAPQAARILAAEHALLSAELAAIPYAGTNVIVQGYRREQFRRWVQGFGFVVPRVAGRRILSTSFSSEKYAGRAPEDCVLTRTFVGGACQPELLGLRDAELESLVAEELGELLGLEGAPQRSLVVRWQGVMPQYHVGHLERIARIDAFAAEMPGLELAGNAYRGVGIPQCVASGEGAAGRTLEYLTKTSSATPHRA